MEMDDVQYTSPPPPFPMAGMFGPNHHTNGNMILMTNPEEEIERMEANFRGQVLNTNGEYEKKYRQRMNEEGISEISAIVRSIVNRATIMSNISEKSVFNLMDHMAETLAKILMVNKETYNIHSDAERTSIYFQALTTAMVVILRGKDGDDKKFWKGSTQEINYGMIGNQPQQKPVKFAPGSWTR